MGRPGGQLARSLAALTIGVHQGTQQRAKALVDTHTGEWEQQVHVSLSGSAGTGWGSVDQAVNWELPFLYNPLQRRVPFLTPHFGYGIEHTAGQGELVLIHAHVIGWAVTDAQWFVGATVRFAASAPNATVAAPYAATAHLSFQGRAAPTEGDELSVGVTP